MCVEILVPCFSFLVEKEVVERAEGTRTECGVFRYLAPPTSAPLPVVVFFF
jgi:hypothetical protein